MSADITVLAANHVQHVAGPLQSDPRVVLGKFVRVWRIGCTCGYLPHWQRSIGMALEINAAHFNRASR